jgi:dimethylargininase
VVARFTRFSAPFVDHDAGTLLGALVVQPSFAIETLAPIQGEASTIAERALDQHDLLIARLRADGVNVMVLEADLRAPLGVAAADVAVMLGSGAVLMRPSELARRAEVVRVEAALLEAQIPIVGRIAPPGLLDGGDVLLGPGTLYVAAPKDRSGAVGIPRAQRGNALGRSQMMEIARTQGLHSVEVTIAGDARRLRAVASFVEKGTIVLASDLVDASAFAGLERIEVPRGEEYGAGVLSLGSRRALANVRFRQLLPVLRRAKVVVDAIDLWEFGKLGMTPSTLVLALKRG